MEELQMLPQHKGSQSQKPVIRKVDKQENTIFSLAVIYTKGKKTEFADI